MIVILNYGVGNFGSVEKALRFLGKDAKVSNEKIDIIKASKIILPGVGAFRDAISFLKGNKFIFLIREMISKDIPILGICLGLQLFFSEDYEDGLFRGLDLFRGKVIKFQGNVKIPHMGWNSVHKVRDSFLLRGIPDDSYFYFANSYYALPENNIITRGITNYGMEFSSVVEYGPVFGTQFHPEKSGEIGLKVLENFANL